jgi:hypothetical protein
MFFNENNTWEKNKPEFATWGNIKYILFGDILLNYDNCAKLGKREIAPSE